MTRTPPDRATRPTSPAPTRRTRPRRSPDTTAKAAYRYDGTAYRSLFERHFTYLAGVERNSHRYAGRAALHDPGTGRRWSYSGLWRDVGRLASGLAALGVGVGDVVALQLRNSPEFALSWLATLRLGAVAAPINFRLSPGETAYVLDDSRPRAFIYDTALGELAQAALARAEHTPSAVIAADPDGQVQPPPGALCIAELLSAGRDAPPAPAATVYDETTRLYTSGTTGMPKGVSLNNLVEVLSAHDVIMHFPLGPEDRTLNMTPWFHRGGLYSGGPNPAFYVGAEVVALRQFDAAVVLDWVERYALTFLIGAPTNLAMLSAEQGARPRDLSSLRGIVTMGAPLEREACLRYQQQLTPRIFNGYGTTEAFWNTFLRPSDLPDHAGSAGRACTDDDVRVVRIFPDHAAAPTELAARDGSEVGEVVVRSPKAGLAYVNHPEEEAAVFRDGWLYIGDLATWDHEEYVTIVGRKDDMLISGGENIHPVQVETALNEHPGIVDTIVVGLPDESWGELVVAYIIRADPALDVAACDAHCRAHPMLAAFKRPRAYRFVDELPFTATGKKLHYQVRQWAIRDQQAGLLERP